MMKVTHRYGMMLLCGNPPELLPTVWALMAAVGVLAPYGVSVGLVAYNAPAGLAELAVLDAATPWA